MNACIQQHCILPSSSIITCAISPGVSFTPLFSHCIMVLKIAPEAKYYVSPLNSKICERSGFEYSSRGQSITIAICKCIGTLTPTIFGAMGGNMFIVVTGIICFVLDLLYIYFLHGVQLKERRVLTN